MDEISLCHMIDCDIFVPAVSNHQDLEQTIQTCLNLIKSHQILNTYLGRDSFILNSEHVPTIKVPGPSQCGHVSDLSATCWAAYAVYAFHNTLTSQSQLVRNSSFLQSIEF